MIEIIDQKFGTQNSRYLNLQIGTKKLATPTYFPSISTTSTRMSYSSILRTLVTSGFPQLLVSCYDLHKLEENKKEVSTYLKEYLENKNLLFLNSGEFERYYFKASDWDFERLE